MLTNHTRIALSERPKGGILYTTSTRRFSNETKATSLAEVSMSTIRNNSITQQQNYMNRMRADVNTVDAKEASHAAQTGASSKIAQQVKNNKTKSENSWILRHNSKHT